MELNPIRILGDVASRVRMFPKDAAEVILGERPIHTNEDASYAEKEQAYRSAVLQGKGETSYVLEDSRHDSDETCTDNTVAVQESLADDLETVQPTGAKPNMHLRYIGGSAVAAVRKAWNYQGDGPMTAGLKNLEHRQYRKK